MIKRTFENASTYNKNSKIILRTIF